MERGPRLGEALLTLRDELVDSIVPVRECRALTGGPDLMTDGDTTHVAELRNGALNQGRHRGGRAARRPRSPDRH
jgi:hypothetical protein